MGNVKDMLGQRCGRLIVISRVENDKHDNAMWLCRCDCGKEVIVQGTHLRSGKTKSCGCYQRDKQRNRLTRHGYSGTPLYKCWHAMKRRCTIPKDENYKNYGGRGITVCDEWLDPINFIEWALANGYKEGLTLERIDVNGNYEPNNCTWVTRELQNKNTRRNIKVQIDGKFYTLAELAKKVGVTRGTMCRWYHQENLRGKELVKRAERVPKQYRIMG